MRPKAKPYEAPKPSVIPEELLKLVNKEIDNRIASFVELLQKEIADLKVEIKILKEGENI